MLFSSKFTILLSCITLLNSCASLIQNDFIEAERKPPAFSLKNGIQVWDNSPDFPYEKIEYVDSINYANGSTYKELELQALSYANRINAHGIHVLDISNGTSNIKIDVGSKRAELVVNDFNLEEHGLGPDTLHFSKNVYSKATSYNIYVKFFVYKKDSPRCP